MGSSKGFRHQVVCPFLTNKAVPGRADGLDVTLFGGDPDHELALDHVHALGGLHVLVLVVTGFRRENAVPEDGGVVSLDGDVR